jgi:hypothetical protein
MLPPGDRCVVRIGDATFRAWTDRPDAGAEFLNGREWVWTPIPSGAIMAHPRAVHLSLRERQLLGVPG